MSEQIDCNIESIIYLDSRIKMLDARIIKLEEIIVKLANVDDEPHIDFADTGQMREEEKEGWRDR